MTDLLSAKPVPSAHPFASYSAAPPRSARWRLLRYIIFGLLGVLALAAIIILIGLALSLFRIDQNVQAMIVTPPPLSSTAASASTAPAAVPIAPAPTATPTVTRTPQPTAVPSPTITPSPTATPTPTPPPAGEAITVLLLGSDRRPGEPEPSRTDAIIVARIDPQRQRVALLSLPRDLWVEIPGYRASRINAANMWGGAELTRKTVSNFLGIPIDYTVYIDFEGFIGAIDALGGITVHVEKELYDARFPTMDYNYTVAHFLPGDQLMDGATALMYSRIRHPDNDFARMRRQQAVLLGVLTQLRQQNALESVRSIEAVTTALRDYLRTDMPKERIVGLAWALRQIAPGEVERYVLDQDMISFGVGADAYAEVPRPGVIATLTRKLLGQ